MEGISITKLLVIAVLVILLFGTSKLRTLGADLGAALKGFKSRGRRQHAAGRRQQRRRKPVRSAERRKERRLTPTGGAQ